MSKTKNTSSYEALKSRLEVILQDLEQGNIPLDNLADTLKEAEKIVAECFDKINKAQKFNNELLKQLETDDE